MTAGKRIESHTERPATRHEERGGEREGGFAVCVLIVDRLELYIQHAAVCYSIDVERIAGRKGKRTMMNKIDTVKEAPHRYTDIYEADHDITLIEAIDLIDEKYSDSTIANSNFYIHGDKVEIAYTIARGC